MWIKFLLKHIDVFKKLKVESADIMPLESIASFEGMNEIENRA